MYALCPLPRCSKRGVGRHSRFLSLSMLALPLCWTNGCSPNASWHCRSSGCLTLREETAKLLLPAKRKLFRSWRSAGAGGKDY